MKHNKRITVIILLMFLIAQFIGLYVVGTYAEEKVVNGEVVNNTGKVLPYGMGFNIEENETLDTYSMIFSFLFSFIIAVLVVFLLIKIKSKIILRVWFLAVVTIALGISITSLLPEIKYASLIGLAVAIPFSIVKIYKRNVIVHNLTELLIYPGVAAIFVPILGLTSIIVLLILISVYDMWAVWKSKIMQKMAKYQMNELKIFGGFLIPYASKKVKDKIKLLKSRYTSKKSLERNFKKAKIKINLAILGGGDVVFPIITAGVVLKTWGLIPAIVTIMGAFIGLLGLLIYSEKKKFYPAMPFITAGIFLGLIVSYFFLI
ncbi:MAG: presenilin family intramembrane aspartyl protease [Nanoarchaeota archaeon]|nr:presenilin family intramembrane aspartyl protease [Nanoarchaeota archaeon]